VLLRDRVCLWNICVNTVHKGGSIFTYNNNNNNNNNKSRIVMAKAAFNNKRALFTGKMDWELRKNLVKRYIWSVDLYGTQTGTVGE
jgi:hypothetical protein